MLPSTQQSDGLVMSWEAEEDGSEQDAGTTPLFEKNKYVIKF